MWIKKFSALFILLNLCSIDFAASATTNWHENQSNGAQTRLIGSFYEKEGHKKLIAAIHFKISTGWKIYGADSDGIGLPPSFDFKGSTNYKEHKIIWPKAEAHEEKIGKETIKYSSYTNEVIIPIEIDFEKENQELDLTLRLDYGLCKDVCIPASESFSLKIPNEIDQDVLSEIQKFYPHNLGAVKKVETQSAKDQSNPMYTLCSIIFIALIGGAILNIMPCVLPVLSIKLISVINHSGASLARIRFSFFATILGILSCFVIFAFFASIIKITGNSLGWGLQFQNPYFLIFLIMILAFFTANLMGFFEINFEQVLATILNKKISREEGKKHIFIPNFLSGVLAVLLATPCSAPFLGSAISFALVKDFSVIFTVFLCIGLGFASPYIALLISPKLVHLLPRPGMWMIKIKQLMAGLLLATIVWLVYILSDNLSNLSAFLVMIFTAGIFLAFKIKSKIFRNLVLILLVGASFALPSDVKKTAQNTPEYDMMWTKFDEAEIYRQVMNGKVVLVDITADWCLTCKFNKIRVLQSKEIILRLKRGTIIGMRGDITKPDEAIMNYLHKNNRFAIPFNAVYGPNAKTGLLASELLSEKELLELIDKASKTE